MDPFKIAAADVSKISESITKVTAPLSSRSCFIWRFLLIFDLRVTVMKIVNSDVPTLHSIAKYFFEVNGTLFVFISAARQR